MRDLNIFVWEQTCDRLFSFLNCFMRSNPNIVKWSLSSKLSPLTIKRIRVLSYNINNCVSLKYMIDCWWPLFIMFLGWTMANFGGHAIPGSFFLFYGFWLTVKHNLQHYWRTNPPKGRPIMPSFFKIMDYCEGGFTIFASFVGESSSQVHFLIRCCLMLIRLMSSCPRYHGWTVCGGRATCPPH